MKDIISIEYWEPAVVNPPYFNKLQQQLSTIVLEYFIDSKSVKIIVTAYLKRSLIIKIVKSFYFNIKIKP